MSRPTEIHTVQVPIRATILHAALDVTKSLRCLGCGAALDLSQPDIERPERLVGICHGHCKHSGSFHLIEAENASDPLVVLIPSFDELRKAVGFEKTAVRGLQGLA
jgi:hypothetical protein